jgi:hypothetical protein
MFFLVFALIKTTTLNQVKSVNLLLLPAGEGILFGTTNLSNQIK